MEYSLSLPCQGYGEEIRIFLISTARMRDVVCGKSDFLFLKWTVSHREDTGVDR